MLEQKLFFTRNGEYTTWEKVQSLNESSTENIISYLEKELKIKVNEYKKVNSSYKGILYKICTSITDEKIRDQINTLINEYFRRENSVEKSDFNALLFKMEINHIDVEIAYKLLQKLNQKKEEYNIESPEFYIFLRKDESCIDIRLSTTKINEYKDNSNEQFMNTEVRIYFNLGLVLMTDYSEYTHMKSIKTQLINDIHVLLRNTKVKLEPYKLSDMTLRVLLKKSKKYSSKFKFSIDDFMDVDFNVSENINDDPLKYDSLKEFYDKHSIYAIKISMSDNEDKYISVDGEKGKLISRSKNMEVRDIDGFVELLSDVIKYDYLNNNYIKNIKNAAKIKLIAPTTTKIAQVESLYSEIEKKIKKYLGESNDPDNIALIRNSLFYCLIKNILIKQNEEIKFELDYKVLGMLSNLLDVDKKLINNLFNHIMTLALEPKCNDLLETLDNFINVKGELNVNEV